MINSTISHKANVISDEVTLENVSCPLGCNNGDDYILEGFDRLHEMPGKYSIVKCRKCGLMRTNPRPTQDTMAFYYPEDYSPYEGTQVNEDNVMNHADVSVWKRVVKKFVQFNTKRVPQLKPGRMLEIGCASGAFLYKMHQAGWQVEGIEFSKTAAEKSRNLGYPVYVGAVETAPEPSQLYDMVVGWMVLEHLHEPIVALNKLNNWVKPGGYLVLSVPNAASLEFKIFKDAWYALQLPTHLFHYTPKTIEIVLNQCGWNIEKIFHQRVLTNLIVSTGYRINERYPSSKVAKIFINYPSNGPIYNYFLYPFACVLSLFRQTGRMTIWAKKVSS